MLKRCAFIDYFDGSDGFERLCIALAQNMTSLMTRPDIRQCLTDLERRSYMKNDLASSKDFVRFLDSTANPSLYRAVVEFLLTQDDLVESGSADALPLQLRLLDHLDDPNLSLQKRTEIEVKLEPISEAMHMAEDINGCLDGTRRALIRQLVNQIVQHAKAHTVQVPFLWLTGPAGSGKSTLAASIAQELEKENQLILASFFCKRDHGKRGVAKHVIPTLAHQLGRQLDHFGNGLWTSLEGMEKKNRTPTTCPPSEQIEPLLVAPFGSHNSVRPRPVVLVDALDELGDSTGMAGSYGLTSLLEAFCKSSGELEKHVTLVVVSRRTPDIESALLPKSSVLVDLQDILRDPETTQDIGCFIRAELADHWPGWPLDSDIVKLAELAAGLFVWAKVACGFLVEGGEDDEGRNPDIEYHPRERLQHLCRHRMDTNLDPAKNLHDLYETALNTAFPINDGWRKDCRAVIGVVLCAVYPLLVDAIVQLAKVKPERGKEVLQRLKPILRIEEDSQRGGLRRVSLLHASLNDFLRSDRCPSTFRVDYTLQQSRMALGCLGSIKQLPRFNILGIQDPSQPISDLPNLDMLRNEKLSDLEQYACRYWTSHLDLAIKEDHAAKLNKSIHGFFHEDFLCWLEGQSIMGAVYETVDALEVTVQWLDGKFQKTANLTRDAIKFVQGFSYPIAQNPAQIYMSALPLTPLTSSIGCHWREKLHCLMVTIPVARLGLPKYWPSDLAIMEGHDDSVLSVAFSTDGKRIASGSYDKTVRIWDAITGQPVEEPLRGHDVGVLSVVFSPDGKRIASGSYDKTVRIWDATTGQPVGEPLRGHDGLVMSVAFSPDGKRITSGSADKTVRIWDATTWQPVQEPLRRHDGWVRSVGFSPDGQRTVSGLSDKILLINNVNNYLVQPVVPSVPAFTEEEGWVITKTSNTTRKLLWIPPGLRRKIVCTLGTRPIWIVIGERTTVDIGYLDPWMALRKAMHGISSQTSTP